MAHHSPLTTHHSLKLIFMGSPDFAVPCLQALIDSPHEVVAAYCQPPRPAGRGKKLRPTPVHLLAERHGIPVHTPRNLKSAPEQEIFAQYQADAAIVAAYGLILPQAILDAPRLGCLNVHPSALPRWRGAAPLQRTIMAGDTETAMCIMQMNAGLDTGDILWQQPLPLPDGISTGELHDLMAHKAGSAVLETLNGLQTGSLTATPQSQTGITYADKISKAEAMIDWQQPASIVRQKILGLSPYPAAKITLHGESIKLLNAELAEGESKGKAGEIIATTPLTAACGTGALTLTTLQRAGKRPMNAEEFLRGFTIELGEFLQ